MCVYVVRRILPHFSIPPESVEVMPGGSANLSCVAVGSPMPYVKWTVGSKDMTPIENIPIGKNVLVLTGIQQSATYTCIASSELGSISATAEVKVKGKWAGFTNQSVINSKAPFQEKLNEV